MEDYDFAEFRQVNDNELGLFAIFFDGHLSHVIPDYLKENLFNNIFNESNIWTEPENVVRKAYNVTDTNISEQFIDLSKGGSTAVTAILINLPEANRDGARVDGHLVVARAFGDKSLKKHLTSEPDVAAEMINNDTEIIILASDGLWKVSHA
ncbi:hypothetical protein V6N13_013058 [Hibiscus sabdariffa]|uniref:PPM-type phosphatase domain-containing protein n=1 Tax=Hibiscus sabdariffa TaxID=183260 RepID=A0ABR2SH98_9ROSI